LLVRYIDF